jgi:hypothetical protein
VSRLLAAARRAEWIEPMRDRSLPTKLRPDDPAVALRVARSGRPIRSRPPKLRSTIVRYARAVAVGDPNGEQQ